MAIRLCPDCGRPLDNAIHGSAHKLWEQRRQDKRDSDYSLQVEQNGTITVEVTHQGKRYKGTIPCVGDAS